MALESLTALSTGPYAGPSPSGSQKGVIASQSPVAASLQVSLPT